MSIAATTARGILWAATSQWGRQIIGLLTTIVLARLLGPDQFGLFSLALVCTGFVALFGEFGLGSALVQKRSLAATELDGVFWLGMSLSLSLCLLLWLLSPSVAGLLGETRLAPILRALSLTLPLTSLASVQQAIVMREIDFRRVARIELISTAGGSVGGILLAIASGSVWSLVLQSFVTVLLSAGMYWWNAAWRPSLRFGEMRLRGLLAFGSNLAGFNVVNFVARNVDNLLIGKYLGAQPLGFYSLAYRIMLFPIQNISAVLGRVMFATFSRMQEDAARIRAGFLRLSKYVALVACPLMLGVFVFAPEFVALVFGGQWSEVVPLLRLLAVVGLLQSLGTNVGIIYLTKGRTDLMFYWGLLAAAVITTAIIIGLQWGVEGVALAYLLANLILFVPGLLIPFLLIGLRLKEFFATIAAPVVLGVTACVAGAAVKFILTDAGLASSLVLLGGLLVLVISYLLLIFWKANEACRELWGLVQTLVPGGRER